MPVERKQYTLTQRPQLIDLNQSYKNFRLQFQVVGKNPETQFQAIVLTQEQLDTLNNLAEAEMKIARGKIGGTIVADNDKYQNYFLVLKNYGETDTDVEVMTVLDEIPPQSPPSSTTNTVEGDKSTTTDTPSMMTTPGTQTVETTVPSSPSPPTQKRSFFRSPLFWGILLFIVVLGGFWYYHHYVAPLSKTMTALGTTTATAATTGVLETDGDGGDESTPTTHEIHAVGTNKKRPNTKHQQLYSKLQEIA